MISILLLLFDTVFSSQRYLLQTETIRSVDSHNRQVILDQDVLKDPFYKVPNLFLLAYDHEFSYTDNRDGYPKYPLRAIDVEPHTKDELAGLIKTNRCLWNRQSFRGIMLLTSVEIAKRYREKKKENVYKQALPDVQWRAIPSQECKGCYAIVNANERNGLVFLAWKKYPDPSGYYENKFFVATQEWCNESRRKWKNIDTDWLYKYNDCLWVWTPEANWKQYDKWYTDQPITKGFIHGRAFKYDQKHFGSDIFDVYIPVEPPLQI